MMVQDKTITAADVRKFFDWEPVSQDDTYEWNGETRKTGQTKWIRSDSGLWLGTRGPSTPPAYTETLVDNLELLLDSSDLRVLNYGELDSGRKAYVQIATEQISEVAGLEYRPMITATSSMDGSFANGYGRGMQVIVCLNTYQMARDESKKDGMFYSFKNTVNGRFEVLKARDALNIMFEDADDFAALLDVQLSEKVSEARFNRFAEKWSPTAGLEKRALTLAEKKQTALRTLWNDDERVTPWKGTKFGVIQAVNTYETHEALFRNQEKYSREDRNMLKTMKGEWVNVNAEAEKLLAAV